MHKKSSRKRDAAATRQNIIEAAQLEFAQKGFDGAGLREIAKGAGINVALINRYFGSKEGLFEKAVAPYLNIEASLEGPKETFGARMAAKIDAPATDDEYENSNFAIIRSVGSAKVQDILKEAIERQVISKIAESIGGEHAEQRAALITAFLLGFGLLQEVIGIDAFGPEHADQISDRYANVLQGYADDSL